MSTQCGQYVTIPERTNAGYASEVENGVETVAKALQAEIKKRDISYASIENDLDWSRNYLGQVLRGRVKLKLEHVLDVLDSIGLDYGKFFASVFGAGPPQLTEIVLSEKPETYAEIENSMANLLHSALERGTSRIELRLGDLIVRIRQPPTPD